MLNIKGVKNQFNGDFKIMTAIGGGNQPSNSHQRKLAHSEEWIAKYKERVGTYPATPIELSPNNGVPTEEVLDTFYKMTQDLGVTVTSDVKESIALPNDVVLIRENTLPVGERGYKQLLNTLASIAEDTSGVVGNIKRIAFQKAKEINAIMTQNGELIFEYIFPKIETLTGENSPSHFAIPSQYDSSLDSINAFKGCWENSLRTPTLTTEHEGVHDLLMGFCKEFIEKLKLNPHETANKQILAESIMSYYTGQLFRKNINVMIDTPNILTNYFLKNSQELFTTLLEAKASEVASRTTITQEMAEAVGSTVDHLTQQKEAYLPTVSAEQRKQLTALINLIKDTPLNLQDWWEAQISLKDAVCRSLELPKVDKLIDENIIKYGFIEAPVVYQLANLDREHPELYQFILSLDKKHPDVLKEHPDVSKASFTEMVNRAKEALHPLLESEKTLSKKPLSDFVDLLCPSSEWTQKRQLLDKDFILVLGLLQRLHSSYQFIHATGGRPTGDDLFYSQSRAKGLPIPPHPIQVVKAEAEAKFLAENAHLLDLPKRFMTMLENLDEKELMITMLHRLV